MRISLPKLRGCRQILGINCHASKTEIRQAFLAKAKQWHPDKWDGKGYRSFVYQRWFKLEEAYRVLMNFDSPAQRRRYVNGHRHTMGSSKIALVVRGSGQ